MGSPSVLTMKVLLLVCLSLLAVVSLGLGDALTDKHEELSLKALEATEIKDNFAGISSVRNARETKKDGPKKKKKTKRENRIKLRKTRVKMGKQEKKKVREKIKERIGKPRKKLKTLKGRRESKTKIKTKR